jgi:pre-mRNA 3'-end-processing factor FIP1
VKQESVPPSDKPGSEYPARHTSKIDPNDNPVHPTTGKPILSTDFDADFPTESSKPWRKPGSDITDYFNYGFDEFTWASYCLKQQQMPKEVEEINAQAEQMKAFVEGIPGGGGIPSMPGMPTGSAGAAPAGAANGMQMPGMPSEADMQQMFQNMMAQGVDPSAMDSNQFMQMMMGGGMGQAQPPTGPQGVGFGVGGFDQGNGGFDGGGGGGGGGGRGIRGRGRGRRGNW